MSEGETRQSEDSPQAGAVTVSDVQELIRRKEEIEAQIKANYDVLESGLQVDDEIVEFGSVNTQNFQSLHNIGSVVQHSEGKALNVTVIRRGEKYQLRLVPTRWAGKGLLGCNIIPLQR
ncbi:PREDICTED: 26S proteasome non-ATPase regulatory subunit 9 isoform X2 [Odobenus rosmarus divergens]|uniref:26S proteasome non-ATPase regulatory subunit 9 n=1 Tax=Odobenus rosmarus divergens TaxID=9708 RepID=A0A2U3VLR0_ODORO|nr:PREDICTED: 26S proteasome non-ATPase regulatory subunit 9 isoform X2 [Odobenus rosmarus divergens]